MGLKDLIQRLKAGASSEPAIIVHRVPPPSRLTAGELREAVAANPNHPLAETMGASVDGLPDGHPVYCDAADVLALATNCAVEHELVEDEHGDQVQTKKVGPSLANKPPAATKPKPDPAEK